MNRKHRPHQSYRETRTLFANTGSITYVTKPLTSRGIKRGLFIQQDFIYDAQNDVYICRAGQALTKGATGQITVASSTFTCTCRSVPTATLSRAARQRNCAASDVGIKKASWMILSVGWRRNLTPCGSADQRLNIPLEH